MVFIDKITSRYAVERRSLCRIIRADDQFQFDRLSNLRRRLWQEVANGTFDPPPLLDVVKQGNIMKVTVPDSVICGGEWAFETKGDTMYAPGPRGVKFNLKQISLK